MNTNKLPSGPAINMDPNSRGRVCLRLFIAPSQPLLCVQAGNTAFCRVGEGRETTPLVPLPPPSLFLLTVHAHLPAATLFGPVRSALAHDSQHRFPEDHACPLPLSVGVGRAVPCHHSPAGRHVREGRREGRNGGGGGGDGVTYMHHMREAISVSPLALSI